MKNTDLRYSAYLQILKEELEHEQEMEDFEADFKYYK